MAAPSTLLVQRISGGVTLTWADNSDNEHGFEIWSSLNGGSYSLLTTTAMNVVAYNHMAADVDNRLYKVRAKAARFLTIFTTPVNIVLENPATAILVAKFPTPATAGLRSAINSLIASLDTAGYWDRIDCFQKFNMLARDQTPFGWKGNFDPVLNGNNTQLAFTAKSGLKTDADSNDVTGYIDSGFIPNQGGNNFIQNSASWIFGCPVFVTPGAISGSNIGAQCRQTWRKNGDYVALNSDVVTSDAFQQGYNALTRHEATKLRKYSGAWSEYVKNSAAIGNAKPYLGCYNANGTMGGLTLGHTYGTNIFGEYFSDAEVESIIAMCQTFDNAVAAL